MDQAEWLRCAETLKVIADKTRFSVIRTLMDGSQFVHELSDALDVEQTLLSHHLKVLRDAGMVTCRREGKAIRYSIADSLRVSDPNTLQFPSCRITFTGGGAAATSRPARVGTPHVVQS